MSDSLDANLQLKIRARRRLVGAVAFAGLAAVVLPMVMDDEPEPQPQDVQIRIPAPDEAPFAPKLRPTEEAPTRPAEPAQPVEPPAEKPPEEPPEKPAPKPVEKPAPKPAEKPALKPVEKPAVKPTPKPAEKPAVKPTPKPPEKQTEAQRAAAILSGKTVDTPAPAAGVPHVILIGAFAKPGNVKILQTKIGELGIKIYTEPLESPDGRKTRVRAGPFASRAAAEKALERMKRIGVNGVIAAKQ
jgi:DedD protein